MRVTRDLLNLTYTKRWVIAPTHRDQSVAEHSFRVAVIVMGLHSAIVGGVNPPSRVFDLDRAIRMAISHDADEVFSGDVPGTHKDAMGKDWPNPSQLLNADIAVKVADALETYDWWQKHGDHNWTHPDAPKKGDENRNIRKIRWYCQGWGEMVEAAKAVMVEAMGYESMHADAALGGGQ